MAAERIMVEGVPANVQYDTSAEVCLITTEMVARLGLHQHGESYWMELTSTLGAPPIISTRRHHLHFKTGPLSTATEIVYEVDSIGSLPAAYNVCTAEQLLLQPGQGDLQVNGGIPSGQVDMLLGINVVHLHPREEKLRSGVKLLHSCVSGNYLLTGMMIVESADIPTGWLIQYRSSNTALAVSVASMPAQPTATKVAPVDQLCSASVRVAPQRGKAPVVRTTGTAA